MPTDTERLDFLSNLPTAEIIKKYSEKRGAHWPWTISIYGMPEGCEYDDFRAAVDDAMKREPLWIPKPKKYLKYEIKKQIQSQVR